MCRKTFPCKEAWCATVFAADNDGKSHKKGTTITIQGHRSLPAEAASDPAPPRLAFSEEWVSGPGELCYRHGTGYSTRHGELGWGMGRGWPVPCGSHRPIGSPGSAAEGLPFLPSSLSSSFVIAFHQLINPVARAVSSGHHAAQPAITRLKLPHTHPYDEESHPFPVHLFPSYLFFVPHCSSAAYS